MVLVEIIYLQEFKGVRGKMKRFAHYDLHKVEIVGLDKERDFSYVKVFEVTGEVYYKEFTYSIGYNIINSGDDYFEMELDE
jgi:hypothetical protein